MRTPDLNLLLTLNVLLEEGSVAGAARRLKLSPSAMSRALARLRRATGDPLLVRAGRALVPTPRARALREQVGRLVEEAGQVLKPAGVADAAALARSFTLRVTDGFVENFGAVLVARAAAEAPGARLRFVPKLDKDTAPLRDGSVDLDTGVIGARTGPELRARVLFRDRFVAVVRAGHPLDDGLLTQEGYAAAGHVLVSRGGRDHGPVDAALGALGLERRGVAIVGGFGAALALARATDLVATVPERHTDGLRALCGGLSALTLPFATPALTVAMLWHPRMDADPAHRWLRACVHAVCAQGDA